jgi:hypothetical protein
MDSRFIFSPNTLIAIEAAASWGNSRSNRFVWTTGVSFVSLGANL